MAEPRVTGAQAAVFVEFELVQFNNALARYIEATGELAVDAVSKFALDLLARIQRRTPVDTGRLRASFHAVLPGRNDSFGYQDRFGNSFNGTLDDVVTSNDPVFRGSIEAVVGTNVDYAIYIEAGHSRQAPTGMVAVSLVELTGALESALDRALNDASRQTEI